MQKRLSIFICTFVGFVGTANANLLTNGGFETGDFTGWSNNSFFDGVDGRPSYTHSGSYGMAFGTVGRESYTSQIVTTTPGQTYTVSFWLNILAGAPNEVTVLVDSSPIFEMLNPQVGNGWQFESINFVASGATTDVAFGLRQDSSWSAFDDASVDAVPEPMTLVALGFGAISLFRRRTSR